MLLLLCHTPGPTAHGTRQAPGALKRHSGERESRRYGCLLEAASTTHGPTLGPYKHALHLLRDTGERGRCKYQEKRGRCKNQEKGAGASTRRKGQVQVPGQRGRCKYRRRRRGRGRGENVGGGKRREGGGAH